MREQSREPKTRDEIESFLDSTTGEREAHEYLRGYPDLVCWTFVRTGGHSRYVFSEFPLGSRYKVDFVVLWCCSGLWEVHYIELEPVNDLILTKAGTPRKRLNGAIKQIDDWREYTGYHAGPVREDLARWAREKRDLLGHFPGDPLVNHSGNRLTDPGTYLRERFHIVIGRSKKTPEVMKSVGRFQEGRDLKISTYDRFVSVVADRQAHWERQLASVSASSSP